MVFKDRWEVVRRCTLGLSNRPWAVGEDHKTNQCLCRQDYTSN